MLVDSLDLISEEIDHIVHRMSVRTGCVQAYMFDEAESLDVVILVNCIVNYTVKLGLAGSDRRFLCLLLK